MYFKFSKGWQNTNEMQMKVLFLSLTLEQTTPSLFSSNGVLTDLLPIKKAVLFFFLEEAKEARVTWPPPLFPAAGACPLLAPASLRQHSGAALGALTEREKHSLRTEGLRHIENPVRSHRRHI